MVRILVSGFEPFGGEPVNPTALLVETLREAGQALVLAGAEVGAVLLPVTFADSFRRLSEAIDRFDPHIVLALGLAGGRDAIEIERVAINCLDANIADNSGHQPRDLLIDPDGPAAYFSTLPIRKLEEALRVVGVPARISNTAGTYVCNDLFYRLQAATLRTTRLSGFVHVPWLPEQIITRPGAPSLSRELQYLGLSTMLKVICDDFSPYASRP